MRHPYTAEVLEYLQSAADSGMLCVIAPRIGIPEYQLIEAAMRGSKQPIDHSIVTAVYNYIHRPKPARLPEGQQVIADDVGNPTGNYRRCTNCDD